jgi:hypothetical protein
MDTKSKRSNENYNRYLKFTIHVVPAVIRVH